MLSIATDFSPHTHRLNSIQDIINGVGNPQASLHAIAEAGFSHVHWCHHWSGDFMYGEAEIRHIDKLLHEYGLQIADVHGSEGREKFWYSPQEYARLAGVELVKNRIDFCARFGGDAVVMHVYPLPTDPASAEFIWGQLRKTLDALQPYAVGRGIKLAIENLVDFQQIKYAGVTVAEVSDNQQVIERIFGNYSAEFITFCYDSGHANLGYDRSEKFTPFFERLHVLHLNSNDGSADQHHNLFTDPFDWESLAQKIAHSPYNKPLSFELFASDPTTSEASFLQTAFSAGNRFTQLVNGYR